MRQGFANLDEAERRGFNKWRQRAILGARYQKAWRKLERLQQFELPFPAGGDKELLRLASIEPAIADVLTVSKTDE